METMFYKSTRDLKKLGYVVTVMGLVAGIMAIIHAWPASDEKVTYYGLYVLASYTEAAISIVMGLLIYIFADMLDCLRHIQENTNEICAALKQEPKPEE